MLHVAWKDGSGDLSQEEIQGNTTNPTATDLFPDAEIWPAVLFCTCDFWQHSFCSLSPCAVIPRAVICRALSSRALRRLGEDKHLLVSGTMGCLQSVFR